MYLKGWLTQKWKFGYLLRTQKVSQICMNLFVLLNTKEYMWKNMSNQTADGTH